MTATAEPTATAPATDTPPPPRVRVMHNMVNLRRGPGVGYGLSGTVSGGELLEVLAWNNDEANPWYLVLTGDQRIAWIAATVVQPETADALEAVPVAATIPSTPVPTATSTPTPTPTVLLTLPATPDGGESDGGGATRPPEQPTTPPTEPTTEPPTPTVPPFPTP